ncbi:hypothetical protein K2X92_01155, partial [Candidatus Gracilibacteria bacterium]|nr:hypothetical protein [Candidatus Gracilibacteria bacterium]
TIIQGFLKNFKEIFNEKSLGEELLAVHNAGRYNSGASVGADLLPVSIALMDDIARSTLKTANQSIATLIDTSVNSLAKRITIYDKSVIYYSGTREFLGGTYTGSINPDGSSNFVSYDGGYYGEEPGLQGGQRIYQNYFFGKQSTEISDPSQCTIARGYSGDVTPFGKSVLTEANAAFDISTSQAHIDALKKDTEQLIAIHGNTTYSCFGATGNSIKTQSYWGGNSILSQANTPSDAFLFGPSPTANFTAFTAPIFSMGGMKETTRLSNPSIKNCIDTPYQYTILQPYLRSYSDSIWGSRSRTVAYPDEWNKGGKSMTTSPRFTCIDPVHSGPLPIPLRGGPISLEASISEYSTRSCFAGKVFVDGVVVKQANNTCSERRGHYIDEITVDTTHYEDRYYHTIPSVWSHVSPTDQEIAAAKSNGTTPSLAVDQIRFVEYLAQNNTVTRINYPNFFEIQGKTIAEARSWIASKSQGIPVDLNKNLSDETITKILLSKNWMHGDISLKYKKAITSLLSYSHKDTSVTPLMETAPEIPSRSNEYEIAYLGLPSSFGPDFSLGLSSSPAKESYATKIREIEGANISEETPVEKTYNPSSECGPPDGVPLLQWPSAIMCWIKAQFPPRIIAGACGPITIGLESPFSQPLSTPSQAVSANTNALIAFYSGAQLVPHISRSSLQLSDSISIDINLRKGDRHLVTPVDTVGKLEIVRINSMGQVVPNSKYNEYVSIAPDTVTVGEKGANFIFSSLGKESTVTLRSTYVSQLPNGSEMKMTSSEFQLNISPEYYLISLNQSGSTSPSIDVTTTESVKLNVNKVLKNGNLALVTGPMFIDIYDDIS